MSTDGLESSGWVPGPVAWRRWLMLLGIGCGVLATGFGCRQGAEETGELMPVLGKVTVNGERLRSGQVIFRPDAEHGNLSRHEPRGAIDRDGNFELATAGKKGVAPGWYQVAVIATEPFDRANPYVLPKSLIPIKYNDPKTSGLRVEVVRSASPAAYDIELKP
jgi:hypothetical protein